MSEVITIDATQSGASQPPRPLAYLIVREGEATQVIDLHEGDAIVLGRAADATVTLDDARASREHARVRRQGGAIMLTDLGSRNGTRLNGELIPGHQDRRVRSGDVIAIGHVEIVVAETPAWRAHGATRLLATAARLQAGGEYCAQLDVPDELLDLPELRGAAVIEEHDDGGYACLFSDAALAERAVAALRAVGHAATLTPPLLATPPSSPAAPEGVVVADAAMVRLFELVRRLAPTPTTVLIQGETGVGKEVVAEQLHALSPRHAGPLVRLNCGSLPETLLESELFGHEKGAFTGADRKKSGYLDAADGGTLLLDEIGELALPMQAKLLRVLESHRFMRVGGREEIAVDVRILAATNRDLPAEVHAGRFREDLYFRLAAFTVDVPPLRDRPSEIALLAELFLRRFAERLGRAAPQLAPETTAALRRHRWPGNVRELRNAMERALVLVDGPLLMPSHVPEVLRAQVATPAAAGAIKNQVADLELRAIEAALVAEKGNQTRAARRLGISRRALIYKIEKYKLNRK
jgi:DNA-binding NtrC family response regulator